MKNKIKISLAVLSALVVSANSQAMFRNLFKAQPKQTLPRSLSERNCRDLLARAHLRYTEDSGWLRRCKNEVKDIEQTGKIISSNHLPSWGTAWATDADLEKAKQKVIEFKPLFNAMYYAGETAAFKRHQELRGLPIEFLGEKPEFFPMGCDATLKELALKEKSFNSLEADMAGMLREHVRRLSVRDDIQ